MDFFKKDQNTQRPPMDTNIPPTEAVLSLQRQGLSNNQIIQALQRQGFDSNVILDAMNQAELKQNIESSHQASGYGDPDGDISNKMQFNPQQSQFSGMPPMGQMSPRSMELPPLMHDDFSQGSAIPPIVKPSMGQGFSDSGSGMPPSMSHIEQIGIERIEEIAEAIIDEKWNEIVRSINKIIDWKERTEAKMVRMEQMFADLRKEFDSLNHGVLGKVGEYDKNLGDLGAEIKAMEKVFEKIIPSLTENVHALEKITTRMGRE